MKKIALAFIFLLIIQKVFTQPENFPYKIKKADYFLLSLGASLKLYSNFVEHKQKPFLVSDLTNFNPVVINTFDRSATNNWNANLAFGSEITRAILLVAPSTLIANSMLNKQWENSITYGLMYFEVALITWGITDMLKVSSKRKRPYLYNNEVTLKQRLNFAKNNDAIDSFISGHTSIAFASAVFFSKTYASIYGESVWSKMLWVSSLSLASATGYLRYESGHHFPTDIIGGAIAGSLIGYLIPEWHKPKENRFNFLFGPNSFMFSIGI